MEDSTTKNIKEIYLAGGCFWGIEAYAKKIYGVIETTAGYANGKTENTSYRELHSTDHAETVYIKYDADKLSLKKLLKFYFQVIDPTSINKQGNDRGRQYRTGIYYTDSKDLETIPQEIAEQQEKYENKIQYFRHIIKNKQRKFEKKIQGSGTDDKSNISQLQ